MGWRWSDWLILVLISAAGWGLIWWFTMRVMG